MLLFGLIGGVASLRSFGLLSTERETIGFIPYSADQRVAVAKQAQDIFSIWVNRHTKIAIYEKDYPQMDPLPRVADLIARAPSMTDKDFHYELAGIFNSLRDFHTTYSMPGPHTCFVIGHGFTLDLVEGGQDKENPKVVVSAKTVNPSLQKLSPKLANLTIGDELVRVNGESFYQFYLDNQWKTGGANLYGGERSALQRATILGGRFTPMPDHDTSLFRFNGPNGQYEVELPWLALRDDDCYNESLAVMNKLSGKSIQAKPLAFVQDLPVKPPATVGDKKKSNLIWAQNPRVIEDVFETAQQASIAYIGTDSSIIHWTIYKPESKNLGIIRIDSFEPDNNDDKGALLLIRTLLTNQLKDTNAVLFDIRGNPGGLITMADGIPQFFVQPYVASTARAVIAPINDFLFLNATPTDPFSIAYAHSPRDEVYSNDVQLDDDAQNNYYGMVYVKPAGLLNDADCYSACDLFSAGMQDFSAATIFGNDGESGGGGANVVNTNDFFPSVAPQIFPALPFVQNFSSTNFVTGFTVAWRQVVRAGAGKGTLIEDFGIKSDYQVRPQVSDFTSTTESTVFDRIADQLAKEGEKSGKNNLYFTTEPQLSSSNHLGNDFGYNVTYSGLTDLKLVNSKGAVISFVNIPPVASKSLVTLAGKPDAKRAGYETYTILGLNDGTPVLKTNRFVTFFPNLNDYVNIKALVKNFVWDFSEVANFGLYNILTVDANGWNKQGNALVVGDGVQYKENVDSRASLFFIGQGSDVEVLIKANYDTELNYDFFKIGYRNNGEVFVLDSFTGKGSMDQRYVIEAAGELEVFVDFVSDAGVDAVGVTVSRFECGLVDKSPASSSVSPSSSSGIPSSSSQVPSSSSEIPIASSSSDLPVSSSSSVTVSTSTEEPCTSDEPSTSQVPISTSCTDEPEPTSTETETCTDEPSTTTHHRTRTTVEPTHYTRTRTSTVDSSSIDIASTSSHASKQTTSTDPIIAGAMSSSAGFLTTVLTVLSILALF